jgi:DNA-binding protein H-NS
VPACDSSAANRCPILRKNDRVDRGTLPFVAINRWAFLTDHQSEFSTAIIEWMHGLCIIDVTGLYVTECPAAGAMGGNSMNFKSMSIEKLAKLKDQVESALSSKVAETRRILQSNLTKLTGFGRASMRGAARGKVAPKYRNPDSPSETWAGRGLKPRWLAAALKAGKKLEYFSIAEGRTKAAKKGRKTKTKVARKASSKKPRTARAAVRPRRAPGQSPGTNAQA